MINPVTGQTIYLHLNLPSKSSSSNLCPSLSQTISNSFNIKFRFTFKVKYILISNFF